MSSTQSLLETILGNYRDREKKFKLEAETQDMAIKEKCLAREKELKNVLDKLKPKRASLAAVMNDYHLLEAELAGKAKTAIEEQGITAEKVKRGEATIAAFYASGLDADKRAHGEAQEKLKNVMELIRTLRAEIFRLELEESTAKVNIYNYQSYPATLQIGRLEAEINTLKAGLAAVAEGYSGEHARLEEARRNAQLCTGKFVTGMSWANLDAQALTNVALDPRLPSEFLGELEKIIQETRELKADQRIHLELRSGLQNATGRPSLAYRFEYEDMPLTTTFSQTKMAGEKKS